MQRNSLIQDEASSTKNIPNISSNSITKRENESKNNSNVGLQENCLNESSELQETPDLKKELFFTQFVRENTDGTKRLILTGNKVFQHRGKRLGDEDIPDLLIFLQDNPTIIELDLAYNEIACNGFIQVIDHIVTHKGILKLDIRNNEIATEGIKHLCISGDKLELQSLTLNGNKFGPESSISIALMLLNNRILRELNVAEVDQTASSLVYFTTVLRSDQDLYNDTLKILNISKPRTALMYYFDTAHFSSLVGSMLKANNSLEELYLRNFGFFCHDIELMLTEGRLNKNLLVLDLSGNNVGDFGAEILANWFITRPKLSGLILAYNIITSIGARALSRGLPFSRIKHLDVSYNRIDDSGITEILNTIKKSPLMKHLRLFGNCIDHESAKIIDRMLLSGVLIQNNLDVKPYRINNEWYCARFSPDNSSID